MDRQDDYLTRYEATSDVYREHAVQEVQVDDNHWLIIGNYVLRVLIRKMVAPKE